MPHTFKARPTTDFAKENLFNVLSNYMDFEEGVRALDLFAGTGSISIELVSRGCDQVISVEKDRDHYTFICKVMKELKTDKCLPVRGDVFRYIQGSRERFDFIFADPPYGLKELETLPDLIFDNNLLKEDGLFVLEHGKPTTSRNIPAFWKEESTAVSISLSSAFKAESYSNGASSRTMLSAALRCQGRFSQFLENTCTHSR